MYNAYQNRVSTARDAYNRAVLNYNNAIKDARLQNNSKLAEIAYQALQQQLELSLQGFQYKNNLILEQTNKKLEVDNMYYNRYQDVLEQINHENQMAEQVRQFNLNYEQKVKEYEEGIRQFNEEIARLKKKDEEEHALAIQELELKKQQLEEEKRQFDQQMAASKKKSSGGSKGGTYKGNTGGNTVVTSNGKTGNTGAVMDGINQQSVLALGYGPLSTEGVAQKVASGEVTAVQVGNQIYVGKTNNTTTSPVKGAYLKDTTTPTTTKKDPYWSWLK
jgi:hypothetical protein